MLFYELPTTARLPPRQGKHAVVSAGSAASLGMVRQGMSAVVSAAATLPCSAAPAARDTAMPCLLTSAVVAIVERVVARGRHDGRATVDSCSRPKRMGAMMGA